jgi:hypothetical protein
MLSRVDSGRVRSQGSSRESSGEAAERIVLSCHILSFLFATRWQAPHMLLIAVLLSLFTAQSNGILFIPIYSYMSIEKKNARSKIGPYRNTVCSMIFFSVLRQENITLPFPISGISCDFLGGRY